MLSFVNERAYILESSWFHDHCFLCPFSHGYPIILIQQANHFPLSSYGSLLSGIAGLSYVPDYSLKINATSSISTGII